MPTATEMKPQYNAAHPMTLSKRLDELTKSATGAEERLYQIARRTIGYEEVRVNTSAQIPVSTAAPAPNSLHAQLDELEIALNRLHRYVDALNEGV